MGKTSRLIETDVLMSMDTGVKTEQEGENGRIVFGDIDIVQNGSANIRTMFSCPVSSEVCPAMSTGGVLSSGNAIFCFDGTERTVFDPEGMNVTSAKQSYFTTMLSILNPYIDFSSGSSYTLSMKTPLFFDELGKACSDFGQCPSDRLWGIDVRSYILDVISDDATRIIREQNKESRKFAVIKTDDTKVSTVRNVLYRHSGKPYAEIEDYLKHFLTMDGTVSDPHLISVFFDGYVPVPVKDSDACRCGGDIELKDDVSYHFMYIPKGTVLKGDIRKIRDAVAEKIDILSDDKGRVRSRAERYFIENVDVVDDDTLVVKNDIHMHIYFTQENQDDILNEFIETAFMSIEDAFPVGDEMSDYLRSVMKVEKTGKDVHIRSDAYGGGRAMSVTYVEGTSHRPIDSDFDMDSISFPNRGNAAFAVSAGKVVEVSEKGMHEVFSDEEGKIEKAVACDYFIGNCGEEISGYVIVSGDDNGVPFEKVVSIEAGRKEIYRTAPGERIELLKRRENVHGDAVMVVEKDGRHVFFHVYRNGVGELFSWDEFEPESDRVRYVFLNDFFVKEKRTGQNYGGVGPSTSISINSFLLSDGSDFLTFPDSTYYHGTAGGLSERFSIARNNVYAIFNSFKGIMFIRKGDGADDFSMGCKPKKDIICAFINDDEEIHLLARSGTEIGEWRNIPGSSVFQNIQNPAGTLSISDDFRNKRSFFMSNQQSGNGLVGFGNSGVVRVSIGKKPEHSRLVEIYERLSRDNWYASTIGVMSGNFDFKESEDGSGDTILSLCPPPYVTWSSEWKRTVLFPGEHGEDKLMYGNKWDR